MKVLPIKEAANVRDLGGYVTRSGKQTAAKKVIRSAAIDTLTPADKQYFAEYGLQTIVDFRSADERAKKPDQVIEQVENIFLPIFPIDETGVSAAPNQLFSQIQNGQAAHEQMIEVYRHFILDEHAKKQYRRYFEILLANPTPQKSVLFHCTAGKDRTGFAAAVLLKLLEVPNEIIQTDYLATNVYLKPRIEIMLAEAKTAGASAELLHEITDLLAAKPEYLAASFAEIKQTYGTFEEFVAKGLQLNTQAIADLRKIYLV